MKTALSAYLKMYDADNIDDDFVFYKAGYYSSPPGSDNVQLGKKQFSFYTSGPYAFVYFFTHSSSVIDANAVGFQMIVRVISKQLFSAIFCHSVVI